MPDIPPQAVAGAPASLAAPLLGRTLAGKYTLETLLGEGAMGAVYKARQISLEKTIAIKVMHHDLASDATFAARFHREAKAASRLDHPNSIRVIDFGEEPDGLLYIAMEFLDGRDLLTVIEEESPLTSKRIVDVLAQVLSALSLAHEMGIIHRDLKPENIMILQRREESTDEDLVKVCDFGIAKVADSMESERPPAATPSRAKKGRLTTAGLVIGTPEYMSPEQGRGEVLDARSDLYSVGVILYHLLTGRVPFDATTPLGIVVKHQHDEPIPPSSVHPGADVRLEEVCLRAMRKRPVDRYASAREMRLALRAALDRAASGSESGPMRMVSPLSLARTELGFGSGPLSGIGEGTAAGPTRTDSSAHVLAAAAENGATPRISRSRATVLGIVVGAIVLGGGAWYGARMLEAQPASITASVPASAVSPLLQPVAASPASQVSAVSSGSSGASPGTHPPMPANMAVHTMPAPSPVWHASPKEKITSPSPAPEPASAVVVEAPVLPPAPPPPVPPVVEAPRATPPPPVQEAPPPVDPARARVEVGPAQIVMGGARASSVNRVLSGVHDKMTRCYQRSASASSPEGVWNLRILTDDEGNVSDVRLDGPLPVEVKDCISGALRGGKIDADTGAVTADVKVTFKLR